MAFSPCVCMGFLWEVWFPPPSCKLGMNEWFCDFLTCHHIFPLFSNISVHYLLFHQTLKFDCDDPHTQIHKFCMPNLTMKRKVFIDLSQQAIRTGQLLSKCQDRTINILYRSPTVQWYSFFLIYVKPQDCFCKKNCFLILAEKWFYFVKL